MREIFKMKNKGGPISNERGLIFTASQFLDAYKIISKKCSDLSHVESNKFLYKARYYLLGHSLELSFKSYLVGKGIKLNDLKKRLGHDLVKCLKDAEKQGLNIFDQKEVKTIELLNDNYIRPEFKYEQIVFSRLPMLRDIEKIAEKIITKLKNNKS